MPVAPWRGWWSRSHSTPSRRVSGPCRPGRLPREGHVVWLDEGAKDDGRPGVADPFQHRLEVGLRPNWEILLAGNLAPALLQGRLQPPGDDSGRDVVGADEVEDLPVVLHHVVHVRVDLLRRLRAKHEDEPVADPGVVLLALPLVKGRVEEDLPGGRHCRPRRVALGARNGPDEEIDPVLPDEAGGPGGPRLRIVGVVAQRDPAWPAAGAPPGVEIIPPPKETPGGW